MSSLEFEWISNYDPEKSAFISIMILLLFQKFSSRTHNMNLRLIELLLVIGMIVLVTTRPAPEDNQPCPPEYGNKIKYPLIYWRRCEKYLKLKVKMKFLFLSHDSSTYFRVLNVTLGNLRDSSTIRIITQDWTIRKN